MVTEIVTFGISDWSKHMTEEHDAERDALDTCTGCDWESWDTAPTFTDHLTRVLPPARGE